MQSRASGNYTGRAASNRSHSNGTAPDEQLGSYHNHENQEQPQYEPLETSTNISTRSMESLHQETTNQVIVDVSLINYKGLFKCNQCKNHNLVKYCFTYKYFMPIVTDVKLTQTIFTFQPIPTSAEHNSLPKTDDMTILS